MSTELVAIERINIKKDNGDADALRSCLAHYLQQFLDSASIESMTLHELTIRIGGEPVLNVSDKTGGVGLSGLDKDWQHTETVHKAIEQIILDADVEVFLSYDMIHYFSNKNFYGSAFWTDMLQEFGCEAVRYHGLEYYDVESNVVMLYFDGKQLCDNPDYVPEEEVKDIDAWFCYTFDMELDAGDTFTVKQVDKMQETIASVRSVFGREEGDEVADVDEDCITICTGVTLKPEQIPEFVKFPADDERHCGGVWWYARIHRRVHARQDGYLCCDDYGQAGRQNHSEILPLLKQHKSRSFRDLQHFSEVLRGGLRHFSNLRGDRHGRKHDYLILRGALPCLSLDYCHAAFELPHGIIPVLPRGNQSRRQRLCNSQGLHP